MLGIQNNFSLNTILEKNDYKNINVDEIDIEVVNNYCLYLATKSIEDIKKISNYE